jgi:hypothetical protein
MPEVILDQGGTATQMTDIEYRRHVDAAKRNGQDVYASTDTGLSISIWDCVEHTWSKPLPEQQVHAHYLKKVVLKCSACIFTTSFDNGVAIHANQVFEQAKLHRTAEVIPQQNAFGQIVHLCSGCGSEFPARKDQCASHIEASQVAPEIHAGVTEITMKKFSLDASEPTILAENVLWVSGETSTKEQNVERSKRKRRKNRNRGKSNGYRDE